MMADYVVRKGVNDPAELRKFKTGGYRFSKGDSDDHTLVFLRKEQKAS